MAVRRDTGESRKKRNRNVRQAVSSVDTGAEFGSARYTDMRRLNDNRHRENDIRKEHPRKKTVTRGSKGVKRRGKA